MTGDTHVTPDTSPLIPAWTCEDFLTEAPYAHLYAQKDNKFTLNQMLALAQRRAKEVRFPAFAKMWNAYVAQQKPQYATVVGEYVTMFPDQPLQLQCRQYICDAYGISYLNNMGQRVEVCPHPLEPTARIVNVDSRSESLVISFRRQTGGWQHRTFPKAILASRQKVLALAEQGVAVNSETAGDLVRYLTDIESANFGTLPVHYSVSRLGWHDEQFVPFDTDYKYDGSGKLTTSFQAIADDPRGDFETWRSAVARNRTVGHVPFRVMLAASFASVLLEPLRLQPFICHLWSSTSGNGKTVSLLAAASVWGNPAVESGWVRSLRTTSVGLEFLADFAKNLPLCLDELQTVQNRDGYQELIYGFAEGTGKTRGTRDGNLQQQRSWHNILLSTGEEPLTKVNDRAGAVKRTVDLEIQPGEGILIDPSGTARIVSRNYGHAGRKFVEAIRGSVDFTELDAEIVAIKNQLEDVGVTSKQSDAAAVLIAADRLATRFIFQDNRALTVEDLRPYLRTEQDVDVNARILDFIAGWLAENQAGFLSDDNPEKIVPGRILGKVFGDDSVSVIKTRLDDVLREAGFDPRAFAQWAYANGTFRKHGKDGDRHREKKVRFSNITAWCYDIPKGTFPNETD